MKKFTTLALAGAMSMAMVATAFAGDVDYGDFGETDEWGSYINPGAFVDDITKIATVKVTVSGVTEINGCYEVSANSDSWGWDPVNLSDSSMADNGDGTYTITVPCSFAADDVTDDGKPFAKIQTQNWSDSAWTVTDVQFLAADGTVLYPASEPAGDVAPVAYLAAAAALAGLALVATKKKLA